VRSVSRAAAAPLPAFQQLVEKPRDLFVTLMESFDFVRHGSLLERRESNNSFS